MTIQYHAKLLSLMEVHDLTAARTAGRLHVMRRAVSILAGLVDGMGEPDKTVAMIPLNNYNFQHTALSKVASTHGTVRLTRITEMRSITPMDDKIFCEFSDMMTIYREELRNSLVVFDGIPIFCKRTTLEQINVCVQQLLADPAQGDVIYLLHGMRADYKRVLEKLMTESELVQFLKQKGG